MQKMLIGAFAALVLVSPTANAANIVETAKGAGVFNTLCSPSSFTRHLEANREERVLRSS